VAYTSLTIWEALGVALATVSDAEIVLALLATYVEIQSFYEAYICAASVISAGS
jgi:hypothetical protein